MTYHSLEKGMALPEPRPGFGQDKTRALIKMMREHTSRFDTDHYFATSLNVLRKYYQFNQRLGKDLPWVNEAVEEFTQKVIEESLTGGTIELTKTAIADATNFHFGKFAQSRYSVRQFTDQKIDKQTIESIIRWAQKTPSVCNRQSCRVHVFDTPETRDHVLSFQSGNRGFGNHASTVFVVTSDLQHFHNPGERFQCWVDGGMFSMSLLYAAHSLQLGACALNWSQTCDRDVAMRRAVGIPDNEVVIMMMALGHLPEKFPVAESSRKKLSEIVQWH
jgi:nitroreductase